jgi:hypothetical protein
MMKKTLAKFPPLLLAVLAIGFYAKPAHATNMDAPTASPLPGTFAHGIKVGLIITDPAGVHNLYTIDGTTPSCTAGGSTIEYTDPVKVTSTTTIKVRTCDVTLIRHSLVVTLLYTISGSSASGGGGTPSDVTDVAGTSDCTTDPTLCPPPAPDAGNSGTILGAPAYGTLLASDIVSFTRDLSTGVTGKDVAFLQQFLISKHGGPAALALSHVGATGIFGPLTKNAVVEFQKSTGIAPSVGYVGPKTRTRINALAGIFPSIQAGGQSIPALGPLTAPIVGSINDHLAAPTTGTSY